MKAYLTAQLRQAFGKINIAPPDDIVFTKTRDKQFGDVSTNVAMTLAKSLKAHPRELALQIIENLELDPDKIIKAEVAGGGFINFFYHGHYLNDQLRAILQSAEGHGKHMLPAPRRVNVEFVSANPTGPLSIGHGRQAVLGDVICRILSNAGCQVTREYYFNNAGAQMKRLGESVRLRYLELLGEKIAFPDKHYEGEYLIEIARSIMAAHGESWRHFDYVPFKDTAESVLFAQIKTVLHRLGLDFDVYYNEDTLYKEGRIERIVQAFKERRLTYEQEGALWLKTSQIQYDFGSPPENDKVIVKATGEPTYRLPDMAYHITKFERGFDQIVDIFGADHIAEYPDVLAGLQALGYDTSKIRVLIHQFVTLMKEGEVLKMSKRLANYVTIDEMLDLLGADVLRYFLIMRSHHSHLNFDLELAQKQTMDNPAYYVQNAHARICSIEAKAISKGLNLANIDQADLGRLNARPEHDIISKLMEFPDLTERLARTLEAHPLTTYLEELAGLYHHYQTAGKKDDRLRVITPDEGLTYARLALCRATRLTLANGLQLLGVSAPTYMKRLEGETED